MSLRRQACAPPGGNAAPGRTALVAIGAFAAAVGLTVVVGWHTHSAPIVKGSAWMTPMKYNTAISFVALGAAMAAFGAGRKRVVGPFASLVALLSLLTLAEYATSRSFGIDQMFMDAWGDAAPAGRIAPNTAVCLVILAAAELLMRYAAGGRGRAYTLGVAASIAIAIGLISLGGYVTGFNTFGWGRFVAMAWHTAITIMLLGAAVLVFAWKDGRVETAGPPDWLYLAATIGAVVMSVSLWQALAANDRDQADRTLAAKLDQLKDGVGADLGSRVARLARCGLRLEHKAPGADRLDWDFEASMLYRDSPEYLAIGWVSPELRVLRVHPLEGNRALPGVDLSRDPRSFAALDSARRNRRPALTRPWPMADGALAIDIFVPVFRDERLQGYFLARLVPGGILDARMQAARAAGYAGTLFDGDVEVYPRKQEASFDAEAGRTARFRIVNATWTLRLRLNSAARAGEPSSATNIALAVGLALSAMFGAAVYLAQVAWSRTRAAECATRAVERESAERRRAEQDLEQFFTLSPDMLCVADFDGRFKRTNPAWRRTLGFSDEELRAEPFTALVHPEDAPAAAGRLRELAAGAQTGQCESRCRTRDGAYRWIQWASTAVPERGLIFAVARDVTVEKTAAEQVRRARDELEARVVERTAELRKSNHALRESEELFRKLFEDLPIGAALLDTDRKLSRANRAFCELLGFEAGGAAPVSLADMTHPDDLAESAGRFERLISGEIPGYQVVNRHRRRNGEPVWVKVTASAIRDESGKVVNALGVVEDISEQRESAERISNLNAELAEKLSELTAVNRELEAFNYTVAHDLRAPLRHMDGFSKILLEEHGAELSDLGRRCLARIRDGASRMGRMVDDLLELSRTSRREPERRWTDLNSLVEEVLEPLRRETATRDIRWRIGKLPAANCDPQLMRQVFANLLSNAAKFSRTRRPAVIEVAGTEVGGEPAVLVRDNGVGFSMKYADKLFGVFQRLHRREDFEGTGIGLVTVERIIHKHGGRVWADAAVDGGATFYFTLGPREEGPTNPEPPQAVETGGNLCSTIQSRSC